MSDQWKAGTGQAITTLYAWIADEGDGEGIIAAKIGPVWAPLIGADRARIESYRDAATTAAKNSGYPVCLKMFSNGVVIDKIE